MYKAHQTKVICTHLCDQVRVHNCLQVARASHLCTQAAVIEVLHVDQIHTTVNALVPTIRIAMKALLVA